MNVLRWIISLTFLFFGGWITIANWVIPMRTKGGSLIPVIGGVLVAVTFVLVPVNIIHSIWWVPLFADLGCVPLLMLTAGYWLWRAISKKDM